MNRQTSGQFARTLLISTRGEFPHRSAERNNAGNFPDEAPKPALVPHREDCRGLPRIRIVILAELLEPDINSLKVRCDDSEDFFRAYT